MNSNTTEYIKEKWQSEGDLLISSESCLDMCRLQWKFNVRREFRWKCFIGFSIRQKAHFSGGNSKC